MGSEIAGHVLPKRIAIEVESGDPDFGIVHEHREHAFSIASQCG